MIDSGAFSARSMGVEIPLADWIAFCQKTERKCPWVVYANLDVIGQTEESAAASYRNWKTMRREGLRPIPVYHFGTHERWLRKYLDETDHIALGGLVGLRRKPVDWLDRVWVSHLLDRDLMPKVKVHGMGVGTALMMRRYPWHSVDCTSWLRRAIMGCVTLPIRKCGHFDFSCLGRSVAVASGAKLTAQDHHVNNLSPRLRDSFYEYLRQMGFSLGRSEIRKGREFVVEPGISLCRRLRLDLEVCFWGRFTETLVWPRRAMCQRGFLVEQDSSRPKSFSPTRTLFYFSGTNVYPEVLLHSKSNELSHAGILLSYHYLLTYSSDAARFKALCRGRVFRYEQEYLKPGDEVGTINPRFDGVEEGLLWEGSK